MLGTLREKQEELLAMKSMSPDGKLPKNAILNYKPPIEYPSQQFSFMKGLDAVNEKRPRKK